MSRINDYVLPIDQEKIKWIRISAEDGVTYYYGFPNEGDRVHSTEFFKGIHPSLRENNKMVILGEASFNRNNRRESSWMALFHPLSFLDSDEWEYNENDSEYFGDRLSAQKWIEDKVQEFLGSDDKGGYFVNRESVVDCLREEMREREPDLIDKFFETVEK